MKRLRLPLILLLVAAGVGALLWNATRNSQRNTVLLSDGSRLTFCAVTGGTNCSYSYGSTWQRMASRLPGNLGTNLSGGTRIVVLTPGRTNLIFWFSISALDRQKYLRFQTIDDEGVIAPWSRHTLDVPGWMNVKAIRPNETALYYRHDIWPRRTKHITLRVFDNSAPMDQQQVGEIRMTNPLHGKYPEWTPEQTPLSKREGDAVFTLERIALGAQLRSFHPTTASPELFARASFRVQCDSNPQSEWTLWQARVSDATGNRQLVLGSLQKSTLIRKLDLTGEWTLWPGEKAIRIETLWVPHAGHAPDEILEIRNVQVSPEHSRRPPMILLTNLGHSQLSLWATSGHATSSGRTERYRMLVQGTNAMSWNKDDNIRPVLLSVIDDQGRKLGVQEGSQFGVLGDAKTLHMRIGLARGRVAEFLVRPEMLTNGLPPLRSTE